MAKVGKYGVVKVNRTFAWHWFGLFGKFGGSSWGFRPREVIKEPEAPKREGQNRDGASALPRRYAGMIKPRNLQSHSGGSYHSVTYGLIWDQRNAHN